MIITLDYAENKKATSWRVAFSKILISLSGGRGEIRTLVLSVDSSIHKQRGKERANLIDIKSDMDANFILMPKRRLELPLVLCWRGITAS